MAGPVLPEGFTLESEAPSAGPQLPEGFTLEPVTEEQATDPSTLGPSGSPAPPSGGARRVPGVNFEDNDVYAFGSDGPVQGFGAADVSAEVEGNRAEQRLAEKTAQWNRLNAAFASPFFTSENDAAATLSVAKRLGIPTDVVRANLAEFKATAAEAEFNPDEWMKRNPRLAKLLNRHHELAPAVLRSKSLGDTVRKFEEAVSWLVEKTNILSPEDLAEDTKATKVMAEGDDAEVAALELDQTDQRTRVRRELDTAARTADRQALEVDDSLARIIREKSGLGHLNAVAWQRTIEGLARNKRSLGFEELMRARFIEEHGGTPPRSSMDIEWELHDEELKNPTRAFGDDTGAARLVGVGAQGVSSTIGTAGAALETGGVGFAGGAVFGGLVTGAITRNPAAAFEGAMGMGKLVGGKAAGARAMLQMYRYEAGASFERNLTVRTEEGALLTNDEAMGGAVVEGVVKSLLEGFSFGKQMNVFKGALPSAVRTALTRNPAFRQVLGRVAKEYFESIATETVTEGLQQAVEQAGEYLTTSAAQGEFQKRKVLDKPGEIVGAMEGGAAASFALGLLPGGITIATTPTVQKASKLALERTADARAEKADEAVGPILDMAADPLVSADPGPYAEMIRDATAEGGAPLEALHADADVVKQELTALFQKDQGAQDEALIDATGDETAPQRLRDALEQGSKFEIPIQQVLGRFGASDLSKRLRNHLSTSPTAMSPQEREDHKAAIKQQAKQVEDELGEEMTQQEELDAEREKIEQSVAERRGPKEGKRIGMLFSHFWRTSASEFKNVTPADIAQRFITRYFKGDDLEMSQSGRTDESLVDPGMGEDGEMAPVVGEDAGAAVLEAVAEMTTEDRGRALFIDKATGLRSERAWNMTPRTPGKEVLVLTTADMKAINDDPAGGHDTTNDLLRVIAREVVKFDPRAAVVGPDFRLEIDPGKAEEIRAAVQAALPPDIVLDAGVGPTPEAASKAAGASVEAKRTAEVYGPRGSTKFKTETLAAPGFRFSTEEDTLGLPVPDDLMAHVAGDATPGMFEEQGAFIKEAMYDPKMPGTLTGTAFDAVGERDYVIALDGVGLRDLNLKLGKEAGNVYLAAIASVARDIGGEGLFFTHKSGDEYAAKSDDRAVLESFGRDLQAELKQVKIRVVVGGQTYIITPSIRFGIGEKTYGAADRALNADKRTEAARGVVREPAFRPDDGRVDQLPGRGNLEALGRRAEARRGEQTDAVGARAQGEADGEFDPEALSPGSTRAPSKSTHSPEQMIEARVAVDRMNTKNRLRYTRFLDFVEGWATGAERPAKMISSGEERRFAKRFGIVDPEHGFASNQAADAPSGYKGATKKKGDQPLELAKHREGITPAELELLKSRRLNQADEGPKKHSGAHWAQATAAWQRLTTAEREAFDPEHESAVRPPRDFVDEYTPPVKARSELAGENTPPLSPGKAEKLGRRFDTTDLRNGKESLAEYGLPENPKVREIYIALEKRMRDLFGQIALDNHDDPVVLDKMSDMVADVVENELHPDRVATSGLGWYAEKVRKAMEWFAKSFPELNDPTERSLFLAFVAITSNGQKVATNFAHAAELWEQYKRTGVIPTDIREKQKGKKAQPGEPRGAMRAKQMNKALERLDRFIKDNGKEKLYRLLEIDTVENHRATARSLKMDLKGGFGSAESVPLASVFIGPKIGTFYGNLMGLEGFLTMDMWQMRTINTARGNIVTRASRGAIDNFKAAVRAKHGELTDEQAIELSTSYMQPFKDRDYQKGTRAERTGNELWKQHNEKLNQAPRGTADRAFLLKLTQEAQKKLFDRGHGHVSVANIQALSWFYEQRLIRALGGKVRSDASYDEVAEAWHLAKAAGRKFTDDDVQAIRERNAGGDQQRLLELAQEEADEVSDDVERADSEDAGGVPAADDDWDSEAEVTPATPSLDYAQELLKTAESPEQALRHARAIPEGVENREEVIAIVEAQVGRGGERMFFQPDDEKVPGKNNPNVPKGYTLMPDAAQGWRIFDVFLNAKADASTAIHEAAHVFLEIMGELAARADAGERTRKKWLDTLKWMGTTEEKWDSMGKDEKTALHEKFAEAFEVYASEGSAPSLELEGVFVRFRDWVLEVFRTLKQQRAPINDDIRSVFDRMLATDDEIRRHVGQRGRPLFDNAKDAGMTDSQWADKLEADAEERHFANRKVWLRAKREQLREKDAKWKEELLVEEKAADKRYDKLPAAIAIAVLNGTLAGTDAVVLDRKQVIDAVGRKESKRFRTAITGGRNIDELGIASQFPNGKAMLEAVAALPSREEWVKAEADAAMKKKHGDLLTERTTLQKEVAGGLHDYIEKQQLEEFAALTRKGAKPGMGAPSIPAEAIREAAANMMNRRSVKSLNGQRVLAAERTAANAKAAHAAKGELDMATSAAKRQLLNSYLYRETMKALDDKEALTDLAKQLTKTSAQAKLGKASKEYRDAANFILETLGLKASSGLTSDGVKGRAIIDRAVAEMNGAGFAIGDPEWKTAIDGVLTGQAAYRTGDRMAPLELNNLTVLGMRAVKDALKSLDAAANSRNTVLREGKRVDIERSEAEIVANLESTRSKKPTPATKGTETAGEELRSLLSGADGFLRNPIDKLRELVDDDQESETFKVLVNPVRRGKYREAALLETVIRPIIKAMERMPAAMKKTLRDPVDASLFPNHTPDFSPPRYRHELLVMALNYGNESNAQRLRDGRNITDAEVKGALNLLTREELEWVQHVFDAAEKLRPEAFALEERLSGLPVKAIQARPVALTNGTLAGGYFPVVYERSASTAGEKQEASSVLDPNYTRPSTPHGHLKGRADKVAAVVSLAVGNVYRGLAQTAHDIAFREALLSAAAMVQRPKVQKAIKQRYGVDGVEQLMRWYTDIGGAQGGARNTLERAVSWIRSNMAPALLGFRPGTALGDFANLLAAVPSTKLKVHHLSSALNAYLESPKRARELALEKSEELRLMSNNLRKQYNEQVRDFTARGVFDRGPLAWLKDNSFFFMETVSKMTATPVWLGAYRQALSEGRPEAEAVRWANDILAQVFPSHSPVEQSALIRDRGYAGLATVFGGYLNTVYRANARLASPLFTTAFEESELLTVKVSEDSPVGFELGGKVATIGQVAGTLLAFTVAWQIFGELFMGKGAEAGDDDDEEPENKALRWRNWAGRKLLTGPIQTLPLISEVSSAIDAELTGRRAHGRGGVVAEWVLGLGKSLSTLKSEDKTALDKLEAVWRLLGAAKGMPQGMNPSLRYLLEVGMDERVVPNAGRAVGGLVYGERDGRPDNAPQAIGDALE